MKNSALTGTPKQIQWAESLRAATFAEIDRQVARYSIEVYPNGQPDEGARDFGRQLEAVKERLKQATEAKVWIDSRDSKICWRLVQETLRTIKAERRAK